MSINADFRYKKPSEEIIRDLIWFSNGFRVPNDVVTFGNPVSFTPYPGDSIRRDTRVTLTGKITNTRYFQGSTTVFYRRLTFQELTVLDNKPIVVTNFPFTTWQILDQLNERYGIMLEKSDVFNIVYETMEGPFKVVARPESLVWQGELDLTDVVFENLDLLKVTDLSGFQEVDDTLPWVIYQTKLDGLVWRPAEGELLKRPNLSGFQALFTKLSPKDNLSNFDPSAHPLASNGNQKRSVTS